jgi:hypothetical protein
MSYTDLTSTIEDAIQDAELPTPELTEDPTPTESLETAPEPVEETTEPSQETTEVSSPAQSSSDVKPTDDFDKKFGLTPQSSSGRENRIPYHRVKKITEKAVSDALAAKAKEYETGYVPTSKVQEYETRIKQYEANLTKVAEFEHVMVKEPIKFLKMLAQLPQYDQIFNPPAQAQVQEQVQPPVGDDMPQPDQTMPDGSSVYSLEGLKKLTEWTERRAEERAYNRVIKEVDQRYAPLKESYDSYQRVQAVIPQVQQQIAEARTWPMFTENEDSITKALQDNPHFTLERAYQAVVWPKFQAERERLTSEAKVSKDSVRAEVLAELKKAPRSTSVSTQSTKASQQPSGEPRSIEDVIRDSIKGLK